MTHYTADTWPEPPLAGTEAEAVLGALERQRATLEWKCSGLDAAGLRATLGTSTVTLGGLLKHLAHVEDSHFSRLWLAAPAGPPWDAVDWEKDPDWAYRTAADHTPDELLTLWRDAVARSRAVVERALAQGGLDQLGAFVTRSGGRPNLRRILLDLVEEYARHAGHADLIRESVDGLVGEDPAM
ncbi:DinB family protein [Streptomyces indicus]|uniref:DinB superfamily protein n=1 Tax=Streptomyces indicus TaxID=417292 RepID=A0A1G8ZMK0_9ACTN|nr:DinB family protein [Streptomyces indicus]SDK15804.1 Protein of unknown function [Streptomyces indicus]